MDSRRYILILSFVFSAHSLTAGEVSENSEHSPLSTLIQNVEQVGVYNTESGTVRLTGHLAEQLDAQVVQQIELSRQESNEEEAIAFAKLQAVERGPAILSADAIIGEQQPESYPSFVGVPEQTTALGEELPLKPSSNPIDTGNLKGVASVLKNYQENSAGKLPIPYKTAPPTPGSGNSQKAKPNSSGEESPYEDSNSGTTFGRNPSDDTAISDLVKKKGTLEALAAALAQKRENEDLKALDVKEKERLEREKKEKEAKDAMSKIKDIENDPYDLQDYKDVRNLFDENADLVQRLAQEDPAFAEKVAEIANFVPPGSQDGKSFSELDSERKKKEKLLEFVENLQAEGQGSLFPGKPSENNKRIRVERAH